MESDLIYDIGMHTGEDTEFYLKKGFRVVAVEANKDLCQDCEEKFAEYVQSGQLRIVRSAIAETEGTIDFYLNENSVWGTANTEWVKRNEGRGAQSRKVTVPATTIQTLIRQFGIPYYMKVDIEGLDYLCLKGLIGMDERPKYISVESSATLMRDTFEHLTLFEELGYKRFKIVSQHDIKMQKCPSPPKEGNYVEHQFKSGSSGLFGEETPGDWQSLEFVKKEYRRIHLDCRMVGLNNGIFRIFRFFPNWKVQQALLRLFPRGRGWYDTHATF